MIQSAEPHRGRVQVCQRQQLQLRDPPGCVVVIVRQALTDARGLVSLPQPRRVVRPLEALRVTLHAPADAPQDEPLAHDLVDDVKVGDDVPPGSGASRI
jgi:hypothetical protein